MIIFTYSQNQRKYNILISVPWLQQYHHSTFLVLSMVIEFEIFYCKFFPFQKFYLVLVLICYITFYSLLFLAGSLKPVLFHHNNYSCFIIWKFHSCSLPLLCLLFLFSFVVHGLFFFTAYCLLFLNYFWRFFLAYCEGTSL